MILVVVSYVKPIEEVERHVAEHRQFLAGQLEEKHVLFYGRRTPPVGGVIVFNMKEASEVDAIMKRDPFVVNGISRYELYDFTPTRADERIADILVK
jgi:uncharacterized protein YciI